MAKGTIFIDTERDPEARCTGCAICALVCPDVCITVYREARAHKEAAHGTRAS
jgi:Pyruvate/2-oxoacid:ferredoxin oxidoreductase delta subunit